MARVDGIIVEIRLHASNDDAPPIGVPAPSDVHHSLRQEALQLAARETSLTPTLEVARQYARFLIEGR